MKKFIKILVLLLIILLIGFGIYKVINHTKNNENFKNLENYLSIIYGKTYLIPEFDDINNSNEDWLWDNINQYLNSNPEFEERNSKQYDYTYNEINQIAKDLYGNSLQKDFPIGDKYMRYNNYNNKYGPTAYGLQYYYDYKIDSIKKNKNIYTVSIYDFTVSLYRTLGENPDDLIDIYNNYDFLVNGDDRNSYTFCKNFR